MFVIFWLSFYSETSTIELYCKGPLKYPFLMLSIFLVAAAAAVNPTIKSVLGRS